MKWLAGKPGIPGSVKTGAVKVPTICIDVLEALGGGQRDRRPRGDYQRARVSNVDVLIINRVDDASTGYGNQDLAGKQAGRDGWNLAAGIVVERVGARAAIQEQDGAGRHAWPGDVGHVRVGATEQRGDDARRRVHERDVVVVTGERVEREARQSSGGSRDVDNAVDAIIGDVGNRRRRVENDVDLVGDIGRLEVRRGRRCRRVGELDRLEAADDWPGGGAERLVGIAVVVEGVVGRRGGVGDRLQAGVIQARRAGERPLASSKSIEPYWPTWGNTV